MRHCEEWRSSDLEFPDGVLVPELLRLFIHRRDFVLLEQIAVARFETSELLLL